MAGLLEQVGNLSDPPTTDSLPVDPLAADEPALVQISHPF
jgi:hypothetical protein